MHGVSSLTVDYNEKHNNVQLRVRVQDKWIDLFFTQAEAVDFANAVLFSQSLVKQSVEGESEEVYNDTHDNTKN